MLRSVTLSLLIVQEHELHQRGKNPTLTLPYNPPPEAPVSLVSSSTCDRPLGGDPEKKEAACEAKEGKGAAILEKEAASAEVFLFLQQRPWHGS